MSRRQVRARWRSRLGAAARQGVSSPAAFLRPSAPVHVAGVSLRIEELRLQSFSRRDGLRIADALQQELSSLLARDGVPASWFRGQALEQVRLGDLRFPPGAKAHALGEQLAGVLLRIGEDSDSR